jgi:hypothetical protein
LYSVYWLGDSFVVFNVTKSRLISQSVQSEENKFVVDYCPPCLFVGEMKFSLTVSMLVNVFVVAVTVISVRSASVPWGLQLLLDEPSRGAALDSEVERRGAAGPQLESHELARRRQTSFADEDPLLPLIVQPPKQEKSGRQWRTGRSGQQLEEDWTREQLERGAAGPQLESLQLQQLQSLDEVDRKLKLMLDDLERSVVSRRLARRRQKTSFADEDPLLPLIVPPPKKEKSGRQWRTGRSGQQPEEDWSRQQLEMKSTDGDSAQLTARELDANVAAE